LIVEDIEANQPKIFNATTLHIVDDKVVVIDNRVPGTYDS
jgi:hypothetical protein